MFNIERSSSFNFENLNDDFSWGKPPTARSRVGVTDEYDIKDMPSLSIPDSNSATAGNESFKGSYDKILASLLSLIRQIFSRSQEFLDKLLDKADIDSGQGDGQAPQSNSSGYNGGPHNTNGSSSHSNGSSSHSNGSSSNSNGSSSHSSGSSSNSNGSPSNGPNIPRSVGGSNAVVGGKVDGRYNFQGAQQDSVKVVKDPVGNRTNVLEVNFQKGMYTSHSTSPRAELSDSKKLKENGSYNVNFGMMQGKSMGTTFFQVLDHNGSTPKPRMWLSTTKDNHIVLKLKESADPNAKAIKYDLGKAEPGKWKDFNIDFKRGVGNGSLKVSIDGREVFQKNNISTMFKNHSDNAHFKFGQYRNEGDDHSPGALYFSDYKSNA